MSDMSSRRHFSYLPLANPPNSEKSAVEPTALPVSVAAKSWLDEQYALIGGKHEGDVIKCLNAGNAALRLATLRQHDLNRALIVICWDITRKIVDDDIEYEIICELERWAGRHRKPKPDDDMAKRCHFLAILMFSTDSGHKDNGASKNGRVVEQLIRSKVTEKNIVEHLERPGGVSLVYREALEQYPRAPSQVSKSGSRARPKKAASVRKSSTQGEVVDSDLGQMLRRLVKKFVGDSDLAPSIVISNTEDNAIIAAMNSGETLKMIVERTDHNGDCIVLRTTLVQSAIEVG